MNTSTHEKNIRKRLLSTAAVTSVATAAFTLSACSSENENYSDNELAAVTAENESNTSTPEAVSDDTNYFTPDTVNNDITLETTQDTERFDWHIVDSAVVREVADQVTLNAFKKRYPKGHPSALSYINFGEPKAGGEWVVVQLDFDDYGEPEGLYAFDSEGLDMRLYSEIHEGKQQWVGEASELGKGGSAADNFASSEKLLLKYVEDPNVGVDYGYYN